MLPIKDAVEIYAQKLASNFKSRAEHYDSGLLMWLWGHDFRFVNSHTMFDTMDLLIDEINAHPEIYHVIFFLFILLCKFLFIIDYNFVIIKILILILNYFFLNF